MELRHLRYFVAIAEEGHITRAAARLGLQQPPLSQQLRALEAEIGAALFRRTPRGVVLTPAGAAFLPDARVALAAAEHATANARRAADGREGRVQVGFVTSAALHPFVPSLVRRFARANPAITLRITEGNAAEVTDQVAQGVLDVGLLRVPVATPSGVVMRELLREDALLALPADHPLLGAWQPGTDGPPLRLRALAEERFILVRRGGAPGLYENLVLACRRAGFEPQVVAQVDRMLSNLNLVAAGVGVSVVPGSMRSIHPSQVAYCAIRDRPQLQAPLTLLHRTEISPAAQRFAALALEGV
jgi:DNA-binding transcriptional LysR family regulator